MRGITAKQKQVYDCIVEFTNTRGYPPTVREICEAVGVSSPSTVHAHIKALERHGVLQKDERKTRALSTGIKTASRIRVPVLGRVTAGAPILAVEDIEDYVDYETTGSAEDYFALRVRGDSMINAGIFDGDTIIVHRQPTAHNGEIVVALLGDEATVKRLKLDGSHVLLMPENPAYDPIDGDEASILGRVKALYRNM